jgi:serine/threonine protein phosphatase PrpC
MLQVEFGQYTNPGRVREHNEDYLGCVLPDAGENPDRRQTHGWLFALADGVGGQQMGEVASETAVESVVAGFRNAAANEAHTSLLTRLVQQANSDVIETATALGPKASGMATTLVVCALRHDRAVVAHVGDSRCYQIRGGRIAQLTRDHTLVNEQMRMGILSAEEAGEADTKHILSRSMGKDLFVSTDVTTTLLEPGDMLLLCSDGVHNRLPEAEMVTLAAVGSAADAAEAMVARALELDGSDNASLQLVRVQSVERVGMYRGRPYKLR